MRPSGGKLKLSTIYEEGSLKSPLYIRTFGIN